MPSPSASPSIAIIGSGFGGLGMAYYLKKAGLQVYVLELPPQLAHEGVNLPIKDTGDLPPSVAALIKDQWLAHL